MDGHSVHKGLGMLLSDGAWVTVLETWRCAFSWNSNLTGLLSLFPGKSSVKGL